MAHAIWLPIPWLLFAVALGLKIWKLARLFSRQLRPRSWQVERFRTDLERQWQRSRSMR